MDKTQYRAVLEQLALEAGCRPEDFFAERNIITLPAFDQRRRRFVDKPFLFKMITLGGNAVISAEASLHGWLEGFIEDKQGHWLFEHDSLREIDKQLEKHGKQLWQTHHMLLPKREAEAPEIPYPVKWFCGEEIHQFYAGGRFPNALCTEFLPHRPDMLAVCAYSGQEIVGMAGCSADTPQMWQIGIDVAPGFRGRGIGTALVCMLKNEISRRGKIPYYGTSLSNLHSWNIALSCGFYPAWVEVESKEW